MDFWESDEHLLADPGEDDFPDLDWSLVEDADDWD